jgi:hypothetical protein
VGVDAGSVYSSVRIRLDSLDGDLKGVYARLNQLEKGLDKIPTKSTGSFGKFFNFIKTSGVIPFITVGAAVMKLGQYINDSIQVSIAAQETFSKFGVVFGGIKSKAEEVADAFADSFDLAGVTAQKLLGNTGDLLTGMGATQTQALDLSVQVNTLAADLASFTNIEGGTERASQALTAAMLGEREQAKMLGIVIREADVQQELLKRGQQDLVGEAKLLATAQATLAIAMRQSKNALGDYARTADSAANSQKRAAEAGKNLQVALGTALNPVVTVTSNLFTGISEALTNIINKSNAYTEAMKAGKAGNATLEQRLLLLDKQIKDEQALARAATMPGVDPKDDPLAKVHLNRVSALQAEKTALVDSLRYQGIGNKAEQDAAAESEKVALKKKADADAVQRYLEQVAERYAQTEEGKIASLRKELATWEAYAKTASATAPQVQAVISDIKANIESLTDKTKALTEAEQYSLDLLKADRDARKSDAQDIAEGNRTLAGIQQDMTDSLLEQNVTERELIELQRKKKIETIKAASADKIYKDAAIDAVNEYYDVLADRAAFEEFMGNLKSAFSFAVDVYNSLSEINLTNIRNDTDAQLAALEEVQAAEEQALSDRYDSLTAALDAELQARLYAAGLVEAETIAQLQAELEAAKASGDEEAIAAAEKALEKATIEEEFAARKKALLEQQAAEEKALEERQAKEKAEIQYKYEVAAWEMKVASSIANAAMAVLNGLMTQPFIPAGVAAGIAAGIAGGVQVAAVVAAKPKLTYATGGIVPGTAYSGDSIPARLNSGEMVLNDAQQAALFSLANGGGGASQVVEVPVYLDGHVIAKAVVQLVNDRQFLIKAGSVI